MHAVPVDLFGQDREFCPGDRWKTFLGADPSRDPPQRELEDCPNPRRPPTSDEALLNQTLRMMERFNIKAVLAGDVVGMLLDHRTTQPRTGDGCMRS